MRCIYASTEAVFGIFVQADIREKPDARQTTLDAGRCTAFDGSNHHLISFSRDELQRCGESRFAASSDKEVHAGGKYGYVKIYLSRPRIGSGRDADVYF